MVCVRSAFDDAATRAASSEQVGTRTREQESMHPTKKAAHIAGAVYLSMVVTGPFSLIYVPNKLIVSGNATATAANVIAHDALFCLGIVAGLFGQVIFICLGVALYRLLGDVNKTWA